MLKVILLFIIVYSIIMAVLYRKSLTAYFKGLVAGFKSDTQIDTLKAEIERVEGLIGTSKETADLKQKLIELKKELNDV